MFEPVYINIEEAASNLPPKRLLLYLMFLNHWKNSRVQALPASKVRETNLMALTI